MTEQDTDTQFLLPIVPEAEETIRAIHHGAADAIVVLGPNGPQVVTLYGSNEPYHILVERMNDGAATLGPDGTVLYVNQPLAEMVRLRAGEMIGMPFDSLFAGEIPELFRTWTRPIDEGTRHNLHLKRGGEALPVSVWVGPIMVGGMPATLVTVTDLSAQHRADEIAVAERFARSILDQATDAIVVLDPSGRILRASGAAEQIASGPPVGRRFTEAFPLDAASLSQADALSRFSSDILDTLLATRVFHGVEVRLHGSGLKGRTFLLSAGPLIGDDKRTVGSIVTLTDITARKRAEEQQTMMVAELNHRVKNILAIVQSVATQTVRNSASLPSFHQAFGGRLKALSTAHDMLTKTRWSGVELTGLLSESLALYRERVRLDGPSVLVPSQAVVPLSMVLHELMTNAAKYGALSSTGHVEIAWQRIENGSTELRLTWTETGGPKVAGKSGSGFGTMLIDRVVTYDLDGSCALDFAPDGLICSLLFPIEVPAPSVEATPASAREMN